MCYSFSKRIKTIENHEKKYTQMYKQESFHFAVFPVRPLNERSFTFHRTQETNKKQQRTYTQKEEERTHRAQALLFRNI